MTASDPRKTIEAVWRMESAKIIAVLTRMVRDVGVAEELAQDALLAALEQWPVDGVPDRPGAWLMSAAKNRAIDRLRRGSMLERKHAELGRESTGDDGAQAMEASADDDVGDDLLRLVFVACHPVLSPEARVALTLRLLGGLSTKEIARAFVVPEPTVGQRISRAKRTLSEAQVPFEVPAAGELKARVSSVLEVVYLIFNEGYAATAGDDWMRPALCEEAMRLGRILVGLLPDEAEVHGLLALMELHASRMAARTDDSGAAVVLTEQNRAHWDGLLIQRGLAALTRAEALSEVMGPYTLQAAISACHARARTAEETDWVRIAALYRALDEQTPSPIIALNHAVAVSRAFGAQAGLTLLEELMGEPLLQRYHLLYAARGDLLEQLQRRDEARAAFEHAASLTDNERERRVLRDRAAALTH